MRILSYFRHNFGVFYFNFTLIGDIYYYLYYLICLGIIKKTLLYQRFWRCIDNKKLRD